MTKKPKLIAIVGPTSSGKTALAVKLAKKFDGEIVSTDSRQIYRGLDIGAGKVTTREMQGVPHNLLDIANPKRTFSVAQYQRQAKRTVTDIIKRGKIPILCGGTGLYVDSIINNQAFPPVPPNAQLRKKLSKLSTVDLFKKLEKLDPVRALNIDSKNPHRLIRAIEIATALGSVPILAPVDSPYDTLVIGLSLPREQLQERIRTRLLSRIRHGMVAEAVRLHKSGLSWKRMESLGLDYRYLALYLQKKKNKDEMIRVIAKENWLYAKRQMVWFKRNSNILWLHPSEGQMATNAVKKFLSNQ